MAADEELKESLKRRGKRFIKEAVIENEKDQVMEEQTEILESESEDGGVAEENERKRKKEERELEEELFGDKEPESPSKRQRLENIQKLKKCFLRIQDHVYTMMLKIVFHVCNVRLLVRLIVFTSQRLSVIRMLQSLKQLLETQLD